MNKQPWLATTFLTSISIVLSIGACAFSQEKDRTTYKRRFDQSPFGPDWESGDTYDQISGFAVKPQSIEGYSVSLNPPTLCKLGNRCTISGTLNYRSSKNSELLPVNWFQGVSIYLNPDPEESPDWDAVIELCEAESDSMILKSDGSFLVEFDLRETRRNSSKSQRFELAFTLAKHQPKGKDATSQKVFWNPHNPPASPIVQPATIPASPDLTHELKLINEACRWPFYDPDSTKIVRAVNALQPLGKEKALAVLKEYVDLTDDMLEDHEIAFWIIRLLFEPVDLGDRIPSPSVAVFILNDNREDNRVLWPLDPIAIVDGIPFMVGQKIASSGVPGHPFSHIRWVEQYGAIIQSPMSPSGNPLLAADKLIATEKFAAIKESWGRSKTRDICKQAMATLQIELDKNKFGEPQFTEEQWERCLKSEPARMKWSDESQSFEANKSKIKD